MIWRETRKHSAHFNGFEYATLVPIFLFLFLWCKTTTGRTAKTLCNGSLHEVHTSSLSDASLCDEFLHYLFFLSCTQIKRATLQRCVSPLIILLSRCSAKVADDAKRQAGCDVDLHHGRRGWRVGEWGKERKRKKQVTPSPQTTTCTRNAHIHRHRKEDTPR